MFKGSAEWEILHGMADIVSLTMLDVRVLYSMWPTDKPQA